LLGVDLRIPPERGGDVREKFVLMPLARGRARHVPVFVVKAAHEHRELRAKVHRHLGLQPIAQRPQRRPERQIGAVAILRTEPRHDGFEPSVGLVHRRIKRLEAGDGHLAASLGKIIGLQIVPAQAIWR
jgi:hypothetical protein